MSQLRIPAVFMRGGTANAVVFHQGDLPAERSLWDDIFLAAIGSPDPYGRQLDGMGGGFTAVSKVCVIGPPTRADADIDYTFAQIPVNRARDDTRHGQPGCRAAHRHARRCDHRGCTSAMCGWIVDRGTGLFPAHTAPFV